MANTVSDSIVLGAVIQGRSVNVTLPAVVTPALGGLPQPAGVFTSRAGDVEALMAGLDPGGAGGRLLVSAVAGMAGVGKTELVLQAARKALDAGWFPGGVLFVDMAGYDPERRLEAGEVLLGWLSALGIPGEHIPASEQDRARLYRTVIDAYRAKDWRVLVVVDNAADTAQVASLLPADPSIPMLVTSRHVLDLDARTHRLDILDTGAAVELVTNVIALRCGPDDARLHDPAHQGGFAELAGLCGGLPLALRIIAALLADREHLTPDALAASLRDEHSRLDRISRRETTGEIAVRAAFDLSYQNLTLGQARLFRLLPLNPGPTIATTPAAHLAGLPEPETEILLQDLHRAHLVEEPAAGRWRQHDLLRLHATTQPADPADPTEAAAAHQRLNDHYLTSLGHADAFLDPTADPPLGTFANRGAALDWLDTEHPNLIATALQATAHGDHHTTLGFSFGLTLYLHYRRRFNDALTLTQHALTAARAIADRREGNALNNLGVALRELRRFEEAIAAHEQAAEIFRETGNRHGEGMALGNLAIALHVLRRFGEAVTAHEQVAEIFREAGDRHSEVQALNNLGVALRELRRFEEAITAHEQAAEIFRETGNRHSEGTALNNLGIALHELRRLGEAVTAHEQAAEIFRETGDRHGEGNALNNLGIALQELRRFEEAIAAHEQAAEICRETGDRHGEGQALGNLANALQEVGRFDEARMCWAEALSAFDETGDDENAAAVREFLTGSDQPDR
ncbi:tetratricopeptide repeat protein [Phytomonospora sp. NPDC050363]|uniref:tetratricopeptide repeat protein n=1 Tax=Phytomonospora sp. NPDC050363 TaxID=3155642 RepID=UPI0033FFD42F